MSSPRDWGSDHPDRPDGLIPGRGPVHTDGMLVGEAGGKTEHYTGRPFSGKTGDVLTAYLGGASLQRVDLWITNVFPFWTGEGNPDPSPAQIAAEEWRLIADIERVQPKVIGAVGRIATRWFLGDVDMEMVHGVPSFSDRAPGCLIVPIYHPAAGFYEPTRAAFSQEDFMRFAYLLRNPVDPAVAPAIKVVFHAEAPEWIEDAAVDTEGLEDRPWGLSWATFRKPNVSNVWLFAPGKRVPKLRGRILFHNALHDLKILRSMGIKTDDLDFGDTMVMLFDLQLEPQSLKAAAYRHLGLKMREFDEVVRPHFDKVARRWLDIAAEFDDYPKPRPVPIADYQKKKNRLYKPQAAGRRILNILRAWRKDEALIAAGTPPDKPVRLEKRWSEVGETNYKAVGSATKVDNTEVYQAQAEARVGSPFPDFSIFHVPHDEAVAYSGTDAAATALIDGPVRLLIKGKKLETVYEMDRQALPFVDRMQEVGMRLDVGELKAMEADLEDARTASMRKVQRIVGDRWFNPGSPDQVAAWLYSVRGLPVLSYTDSGRGSTSDEALQMLRGYHAQDPEVAQFLVGVQDYREADKFLGTFVQPIFVHMRQDRHGDWRLHANFRVTRVVSGRLSSFEPNVLAMPVRGEKGKRFRKLFRARDGWTIISADFSQLELRVGAHYSGDRRMAEAFTNDEDLHALTASIIFKADLASYSKPKDEAEKRLRTGQRYVAKVINFAVFYGISAKALLEQLYKANIFDYTLKDCEGFIRGWFAIYASVRDFQHRLWEQAGRDGFVRTMFGRICYVPNLRVADNKIREAAQRLAANFPVQGTGSDTMKRAEIRLHHSLRECDLWDDVQPWLQMHDELIVEVREERAEEAKRLIEACMRADKGLFRVPLKVEAKMGKTWAEAK